MTLILIMSVGRGKPEENTLHSFRSRIKSSSGDKSPPTGGEAAWGHLRRPTHDDVMISVTRPSPERQVSIASALLNEALSTTRDRVYSTGALAKRKSTERKFSPVRSSSRRHASDEGGAGSQSRAVDSRLPESSLKGRLTSPLASPPFTVPRRQSTERFDAGAGLLLSSCGASRVDAIAKSVHFLQHQSPETATSLLSIDPGRDDVSNMSSMTLMLRHQNALSFANSSNPEIASKFG